MLAYRVKYLTNFYQKTDLSAIDYRHLSIFYRLSILYVIIFQHITSSSSKSRLNLGLDFAHQVKKAFFPI